MARGCPKRHFEENQISPGLIRLLLLPTAHDRTFQRSRLRTSAPFYGHFILAMGRSPGFGSTPNDYDRPFRTRFRYGSAPEVLNLTPLRVSRRSIMQKVRRHSFRASPEMELRPLVSAWFQVLLTPLVGVLFTFQSPYWFTIGRRVVLSLGGWAPQLHTEFHELRATLVSRW